MKLNDILKYPSLQGIKVAAGANGLFRNISQVGMIDAPDINDFLFEGQLLVTSGFHFTKNPQLLTDLIIGMHDINACGIAIKLGRYINDLPQDVIILADKLAIPILWTPADDFLSLTVKRLTAIILETQNIELREIIAINQQLSDLNAQNITYQHLLDQSAKVLKTPLALLDSHFTAIYASSEWVAQREFLTHHLRHESGIDYLNLSKPTRIAFNHQSIDILPIFSALNENKAFAAFVVNELEPSDFQMLRQQQVMNTLGLANSRTDLLNETDFRNRSGFFLNVMQGGLSDTAIDNYLHDENIDNKQCFHVAIIGFLQQNKIIESHQFEIRQQLTRWFISEHQLPVLTFSHSQQLVLLINQNIDTRQFLNQLFDFLKTQKGLHHSFTIGFSRISKSIHKLSELYDQANNALKLTSSQHPIMIFRPKNAQELLNLLPKQESDVFVEKTLGRILGNEELLATLKSYVFLHQNVTAVASALFVHRNTINYRLKRISDLLGIDLEMPDVLIDIQLALLLI
ncbi:PucR family transcriptional regulator [Leuconostoc inhae]|uniref:PucR family transcriptional regulator n=1 Tax=Leuconostoc inhae TaxID=178001 RepID=UPI001C7D0AA8|nr:PucR family transcriptional regulator [Leuconostoc inhae]